MPTPSRSQHWRHPAAALLLPLALVALGVWQASRVDGAAEAFAQRAERLQASVTRLQAAAARDPNASIRFNGDPQSYPAERAASMVRDAQAELAHDALIERARQYAAWAVIGGGAAALLAVLACLAAATLGAARGRRSRDALVGSFEVVLRLLPPLLGLVAAGTAVAIVGGVLFEAGGVWFQDRISTGEIKLIFIGFVLAGGALVLAFNAIRQLRRVLQAFTPDPMPILGRAVTPVEAPGLWTFLRGIAGGQGAGVPDNIVVGMLDGFFVTSSQVMLRPEEHLLSGRTLYLPAPYLPLLSRGEVSAIVAHELAHFTGDDVAYSQTFLPLYAGMARSMDAVSGASSGTGWAAAAFQPAATLARHALDTFSRTVAHWSRLRELEADRASLRHEAGRTAASALLRTGVGGGLIGGALDDMYEHPHKADPDLVGTVLARAGAVGFTDPARHLEDRQPHPTDSHPPTRQRIEALGIPVDDTLLALASRPLQPDDAAFSESLFADWPALRRMLGEDLLAVAKARDQRLQQQLQEAASAVTADIPIYERGRLAVVTLAACGAILLLIAAGLAWVAWAGTSHGSPDLTVPLIAASVALAGIGLVAMSLYRSRRAAAGPFLVVGPAGFRCLGIAGLVPWSAVDGVTVMTGQAFITTFHFNTSRPLPQQTAYKWYISLKPRKRQLVLKGFVPDGMKPQAYLDLLNSALRAHRAAALLREREAAGLGAA